ncbi:hypothetical protein [Agromyces sp. SYSU T00194]|uniref:hypothetical protein n=1 Tax=Agromyces chitinivorans TaxID=3158560 RepID=UPI0033930702
MTQTAEQRATQLPQAAAIVGALAFIAALLGLAPAVTFAVAASAAVVGAFGAIRSITPTGRMLGIEAVLIGAVAAVVSLL